MLPERRAARLPHQGGAMDDLLREFLTEISGLLRARYPGIDFVQVRKANAAMRMSPQDGQLLAGRCHAVLTGMGD